MSPSPMGRRVDRVAVPVSLADHAREDMICVRQPGRVLQRGEWQTIDTRCLWVCSARSTRKRCSWSSRR